ncbi:MAG: PASTA domain-containing protein [Cellulosilyticum sp.]|nr:PASTA domain-containing protein [Cellulosilyticum sp.]
MQKKKRRKKTNALPKKESLNGRILLIGGIMCGVFALLGLEVIRLTLFKHDEYATATLANMNRSESILEAPRGTIQDRNGRNFATSLLTYNVILSPYQIVNNVKTQEKRENIYKTLEEVTGVSASEIKATVMQKIEANPKNQWYPLVQKMEFTEEQVEKLKSLGGVTVQKTYKRNYPQGELAAHVLGFYNGELGQYGVEQGYEDYLVGQSGRAYSQVQDGNIITSEYQEPIPGATVKLTIDQVVQQYVEDTMSKYINEHNPSKASCIVMNPSTGEIMAMYSYPSYNPNTYNNLSGQLGDNVWLNMKQEQMSAALNKAWKNYGIQHTYEPGSTFKPLVAAMALQEGMINTDKTYTCLGYKRVADRTIPCWKAGGHGHQTLSEALANSCNVAMMDMVEDLDGEVFLKYIYDYGFGEETGIELAGEEEGILHDSLRSVEKATYSMGQTFTVTPIQLITGFSSVINGGYLMEPHVVSEVISSSGELLLKHGTVTRRQVLSTSIADVIKTSLQKVVDEGTGTQANVPGYAIGGKTGTGQKFIEGTTNRVEDKYAVSFMGFAPVENPEVVALIVMDDMPEGTGAPASAFKDMMTEIFPYLEIETNNSVVVEGQETFTAPDLVGKNIYEAINTLRTLGVEYNVIGTGKTIDKQYPEAGATWRKDGTVTLYAKTETPDQLVEVPDLLGMTIADAKALVGDYFTIQGSGQGVIQHQIPTSGYKIEKGNKIIIETSE